MLKNNMFHSQGLCTRESSLTSGLRLLFLQRCAMVLACVAGLFMTSNVAWGQEGPTQAVKQTIDQVLAVLEDEVLKDPNREGERREKLEAIIKERFNYEEMAKRTLAAQWKKLNAEKQQEFVLLFQRFLTQSYAGNVGDYSGEQVEYVKERLKGDFAEVQTKIVSPKVQIPLDYRLLKKNGQWGVYDVIIDGVSMTKNYRGQFSRIIKSSSLNALFDKLRSKTQSPSSS